MPCDCEANDRNPRNPDLLNVSLKSTFNLVLSVIPVNSSFIFHSNVKSPEFGDLIVVKDVTYWVILKE